MLSQYIHQGHSPLPAFRVGNDLALDVLPFVHAPQRHSQSSNWASAPATCVPVNGFGTAKTLRALRDRKLTAAISGVSLMITTGNSAGLG